MAKVSKAIQDVTRETAVGNQFAIVGSIAQRVKDGVFFSASGIVPGVGDGSSIDILFRAVGEAHFRPRFFFGGDATVVLYENPVTTDDGALTPSRNRNRGEPDVSKSSVFAGPTVTSPGLILESAFLPGGEKKDSVGGESGFLPWILKDNDYLIRVTNNAGQDETISATIDWFEI